MAYHDGFNGDADYFDLVAQDALNKQDRRDLLAVASTYRTLAKSPLISATRSEHWRKRAEECRTLSEQFKSETCRTQLSRLADTYDLLADSSVEKNRKQRRAVNGDAAAEA